MPGKYQSAQSDQSLLCAESLMASLEKGLRFLQLHVYIES